MKGGRSTESPTSLHTPKPLSTFIFQEIHCTATPGRASQATIRIRRGFSRPPPSLHPTWRCRPLPPRHAHPPQHPAPPEVLSPHRPACAGAELAAQRHSSSRSIIYGYRKGSGGGRVFPLSPPIPIFDLDSIFDHVFLSFPF